MFGTNNSMEPVRVTTPRPRERDKAGIPDGGLDRQPVREATRAEVAASERRRQAAGSDPVRPVPEKAGLFSRRKAEPVEPDATAKRHGLYMTEKRGTRTYYADYQQKQEVMRADARRISSKQGDRQTVSAMLDLAQERGWQKVRLRGTDDFKREAWVQAQVRGVATEGYKATATDLQELARRKAASAPVDSPAERAAPVRREMAGNAGASGGGEPEQTATRSAAAARDVAGGVPAKADAGQPAAVSESGAVHKTLSDAEVKRILSDAETLGRVWKVVNDPKADPAGVREALDRAPQADRTRLSAEVMEGLERRAAKTGSRDELDRIAPHLRPPGSLAEHEAKIAAMSPEQRDAVSRAALGPLHPSRAAETATAVETPSAQARQQAVWGSVEEAGKTAREAARAEAPAPKAGERAKAEAV